MLNDLLSGYLHAAYFRMNLKLHTLSRGKGNIEQIHFS